MTETRQRRRSLVVLSIALALLVVAGAGIWLFFRNPQTRSAEKLCAQLGQVTTLSSSLVTLDPTTLGPQVAELKRAAEVAPADIQAQMTVLATFVEEVADTVRASPTDKKAALAAALAARQDRIDEVTVAGQAVEAWSITNCGTTLRSTTTQKQTTTTRR